MFMRDLFFGFLMVLTALFMIGSTITCPCIAAEVAKSEGEAVMTKTLDNLQTALSGETNASLKYKAFAVKADEEGYKQVAVLFRAAAQAEKIHADNHANVITQLSGIPKAVTQTPEVKTTAENLKAAIEGETYERDTMYPGFLAQAMTDKARGAVRTFNYALAVETEHAKLYAEALKSLDAWKEISINFYVCSVCGNTLTNIDFKKCPVCFTDAGDYKEVK
jgi:rubrerythrin